MILKSEKQIWWAAFWHVFAGIWELQLVFWGEWCYYFWRRLLMLPIAFEYWFVEGAIVGAFWTFIGKLLRTRILNLLKECFAFLQIFCLWILMMNPYCLKFMLKGTRMICKYRWVQVVFYSRFCWYTSYLCELMFL